MITSKATAIKFLLVPFAFIALLLTSNSYGTQPSVTRSAKNVEGVQSIVSITPGKAGNSDSASVSFVQPSTSEQPAPQSQPLISEPPVTTHNPVDILSPAVSRIEPSGKINTKVTNVTAAFGDRAGARAEAEDSAGSGSDIEIGSVIVDDTVDYIPASESTTFFSNKSFTVSSLLSEVESIDSIVPGIAGNNDSASVSFIQPSLSEPPAPQSQLLISEPPATTYNLVDTLAPSVSNIVPTGTITTKAANITAAYSDGGSSIDTSSVVVKLDGSQLSGCTAGGVGVSCPASGIGQGSHSVSVSVSDEAGNTDSASVSFIQPSLSEPPAPQSQPLISEPPAPQSQPLISEPPATTYNLVDTLAPSVSNIVPTGTITTNATNITAAYSDGGSSIDASSVVVKLDGSPLSGCTAGGAGVSCPASGHWPGLPHELGLGPRRSRQYRHGIGIL